MVDKSGRIISYARISVTDLCNLRCRYCIPDGVIKKAHDDILSIEQLMLVSDVLGELGVKKQRITGGEPLVRKGLLSLVEHMGQNSQIEKLSITTNGQLLSEMAKPLYDLGVNYLNISIDTLDEKKYEQITQGGKLEKALQGLNVAIDTGFMGIKVNAVLLKDFNIDSIYTMAKFFGEKGVSLRFIELMPFTQQKDYADKYYISTNDIIKTLGIEKIKSSEDNKEQLYQFKDGVKVSFISPISSSFCKDCNRVRITADGKLLNCLHGAKEYNIKPYLTDKEKLKDFIVEAVKHKPISNDICRGILQTRSMDNIGG